MGYKIQESDIQKVKQWGPGGAIDDDLILLNRLSDARFPQDSRRMNFIVIALCTQGEARYTLDTQEVVVRPGDILIVSERHVVSNCRASADLEGMCMVVSVPFFYESIRNVSDVSALFLYSKNHPVMSVTVRDQNVFKEYYQMLLARINEKGNRFRRDLVRTLLLAMVYDLSNVINRSRMNVTGRQSRPDAIFTQFIQLVEDNCRRERRVSWYAEQLCITAKYLSETVKGVSQHTPNEWIDNYVTLEIRVLLKNSTKNIKEIAKELNFPNQSFLGKFFKERVGMSPTRYRKT